MFKVYVYIRRNILPFHSKIDRFRARGDKSGKRASKKKNALCIGTPLPVILGGTIPAKGDEKE